MTRVTDEDLNSLEEVIAGTARYSDPDTGLTAVRAIRAELLALRKVADAAVKFRDHDGGAGSVEAYARLTRALRGAGL